MVTLDIELHRLIHSGKSFPSAVQILTKVNIDSGFDGVIDATRINGGGMLEDRAISPRGCFASGIAFDGLTIEQNALLPIFRLGGARQWQDQREQEQQN